MRKLVAAIALYATLAMAIVCPPFVGSAMAYEPPPLNCPPKCSYQDYYNTAVGTHTMYANQAYKGTALTVSQMSYHAFVHTSWAGSMEANGYTAQTQTWLLQNTNDILNANLDVSQVYPYLVKNYGFTGTQAELQATVDALNTPTNRQNAVNYIKSSGLYTLMTSYANNVSGIAQYYSFRQKKARFAYADYRSSGARLLRVEQYPEDDCQTAGYAAGVAIIVGTILTIFAPPAGILFAVGAGMLIGGTVYQEGIAPIWCGGSGN